MRTVWIAGALVLAACSGSDPAGDADAPSGEPSADDEPAAVEDPVDDDESDEEEPVGEPASDDPEPTADPDPDDETGAPSDDPDDPSEPEVEARPGRGGTLRVLLDAETDTWDIPNANCATACITVMQQVADPLLVVTDAGELEPFLLEAYEVNDDFTSFTLTMRDGIEFHDGSPADGAALQRHLREYATGIVQSQAYRTLAGGPETGDGIQLVDELTVRVDFDEPNSGFGHQLTAWSAWLLAPSFWDAESADVLPIATGPFEFAEWSRNELTRLEANPDYWRPGPDGERLPYLDAIEIRPVPDVSTRRSIMEAGDADVNVDAFPENRAFWLGDWIDQGNALAPVDADRDVEYLLVNSSRAPFDQREVRRALTSCTDREEYLTFRAPGTELAFGPFARGSIGFTDDVDIPPFDPEAARAAIEELGGLPTISVGVTNVPAQQLTAELLADQWSRHCDLDVDVVVLEQSEFITRALVADYDVLLWRNHGQGAPAMETVWWHSRHTVGLATNFGRIVDDELDALLDELSATDDLDETDRIGQDIQRRFADQMYNIWLNTGEWLLPVRDGVVGVGELTLESGGDVRGAVGGRLWLHEAGFTS